MFSQTKSHFQNLLSYLRDIYPDDPPTLESTFSSYPHLKKIADLTISLLNTAEDHPLQPEEIGLIVRSIAALCSSTSDISLSEIQTERVVHKRRLVSDVDLDDPEQLQNRISELLELNEVLAFERKGHQQHVDALQDEIAELKEEYDKLKKNFLELKRTREDDVSNLTFRYEELDDQYQSVLTELKLASSKGQNLSVLIDDAVKESDEKEDNIQELQKKTYEQKVLLKKAKSLLKYLEHRVSEDQILIKRLKGQHRSKLSKSPKAQEAINENKELKEENEILREKLVELAASSQDNFTTIVELKQENQTLMQELNKSNNENTEKENEIQKLQELLQNQNSNNQADKNNKTSRASSVSSKTSRNSKNTSKPSNNANTTIGNKRFVETLGTGDNASISSAFDSVFNSVSSDKRSNYDHEIMKSDNYQSSNELHEVKRSLRILSKLFTDNDIRPSDLPKLHKKLSEQEVLLDKFRSTIDGLARFTQKLLSEDNASLNLLSNSSPILKDESLKKDVLAQIESARNVAYQALNGEINEIMLFDTIFESDERIEEMLKQNIDKGADHEFAALLILLYVINKLVKINKADRKFLESIYKYLPFQIDHPNTAEDAAKYIDEIHKTIKDLKNFHNSEIGVMKPETTTSEFLDKLNQNIHDLTGHLKEAVDFNGKLFELPDYLTHFISVEEENNHDSSSNRSSDHESNHDAKSESEISEKQEAPETTQNTKTDQTDKKTKSETQTPEDTHENHEENNSQSDQEDKSESEKSNSSVIQNSQNHPSENITDNSKEQTQSKKQPKSNEAKSDSGSNHEKNKQQENKKQKENNQQQENKKQPENNKQKENNKQQENNQDNTTSEELNKSLFDDLLSREIEEMSKLGIDQRQLFIMKRLREDNQNMKDTIKKLQRELDDANTANEVLHATFAEFHDKNEETEKNALVIVAEKERLEQLLADKQVLYQKNLKTTTEYAESKYKLELKTFYKRLETQKDSFQKKLDDRNRRIRELKNSTKEIVESYEEVIQRQRTEMRELCKENERLSKSQVKTRKSESENMKKISDLQDKIAELAMQRSHDLSTTITNDDLSMSTGQINSRSQNASGLISNNNSHSRLNNQSNNRSLDQSLSQSLDQSYHQSFIQQANEQNVLDEIGKVIVKVIGDKTRKPQVSWTKDDVIKAIQSFDPKWVKKNLDEEWRTWALSVLEIYDKNGAPEEKDEMRSAEMRIKIKSVLESTSSRQRMFEQIQSLRLQKKILLQNEKKDEKTANKKNVKSQKQKQPPKESNLKALTLAVATAGLLKNKTMKNKSKMASSKSSTTTSPTKTPYK
ncbi:hypothetical protein TRFO_23565 [Tritrichomonas foetus]|uniref:Uncharacterized protein n=1 Tax=Tritrichomonas foetus TaxID=1144522 RepID=A0A1J4KFF4_9EUKA|nr:hypothetical protein TRFO_23565 [Tritrichomonas foetus]|eukprot:OHT08101.1 hypothetical protein TRFO_23565 [Tritrichomonas foetus]